MDGDAGVGYRFIGFGILCLLASGFQRGWFLGVGVLA